MIKFHKSESAKAVIRDGFILIALPVANLGSALEGAWASGHQDGRYRVTDAETFAKAVVHELNNEQEDGTTPIHELFDACMYEAIDQGAEGVEEHPDQEGED
jgi:hypothetical protein